jgi:CO dehydrogenase nickel-insertion accessory protein CooC1
VRSAETVRRVVELMEDLGTPLGKTVVVANRSRNGMVPAVRAILEGVAAGAVSVVPEDEGVHCLDDAGEALLKVPLDSPAYRAVKDIVRESGIAEVE